MFPNGYSVRSEQTNMGLTRYAAFFEGEVLHGWYMQESDAIGEAWSHINQTVADNSNTTISLPYQKILAWGISEETYHPGCYRFSTPLEYDMFCAPGMENACCCYCGEAIVSDALNHLLCSPENCECGGCMRTSLAAIDTKKERSILYLEGFRIGASNAFEECKEEGWVDDIPFEQYVTIYRHSEEVLQGYNDARNGLYPEKE